MAWADQADRYSNPAISLVEKPTNQISWFLTNPNPGSASPPNSERAYSDHTPPGDVKIILCLG